MPILIDVKTGRVYEDHSVDGEFRRATSSTDRERYSRWREVIAKKLGSWSISHPEGGSYLEFFLKYSERY